MASRKIYEGVSAAQPIDFITLDSIHATNDTSVSQLDAISVTSWNLLPTIGKTETIAVPGEYSVRRKLIFILNLCRLPGGMVATTATDGLIGKSARQSGGYGPGFEKTFTKIPECVKGSLVHRRAVAYTLGGLRMMVRFEVDRVLKPLHPKHLGARRKRLPPLGIGFC
jgi:hypothetical protein